MLQLTHTLIIDHYDLNVSVPTVTACNVNRVTVQLLEQENNGFIVLQVVAVKQSDKR